MRVVFGCLLVTRTIWSYRRGQGPELFSVSQLFRRRNTG